MRSLDKYLFLAIICVLVTFAYTTVRTDRERSKKADTVQSVANALKSIADNRGQAGAMITRVGNADALASQRLTTLPEDAGAFHMLIFVDDNWQSDPRQASLMDWIVNDKTLVPICQSMHEHTFHTSSKTFQEQYNKYVGSFQRPIILVQKPDGEVVVKFSGSMKSFPKTAKELAGDVRRWADRSKAGLTTPYNTGNGHPVRVCAIGDYENLAVNSNVNDDNYYGSTVTANSNQTSQTEANKLFNRHPRPCPDGTPNCGPQPTGMPAVPPPPTSAQIPDTEEAAGNDGWLKAVGASIAAGLVVGLAILISRSKSGT